ncbi:MAG TPA: hypothetical protein VFN87_09460 [Solirubrobacteraceae bacterium]|nr:hypothetical protein [Solirubrobacteraceae bacterium]
MPAGPAAGSPVPGDLPFDQRGRLAEPGWPKAAFIERCFAGDQTNWSAPDDACVQAMLRSAGLRVVAATAHETYVCERDAERDPARPLREAELSAATGETSALPTASR